MEAIIEADFHPTEDAKAIVMQAMRTAWQNDGGDLGDWAERLGITRAAAEAYVTGVNTPCSEILLIALERVGWPLAAELRQWIDRTTRGRAVAARATSARPR